MKRKRITKIFVLLSITAFIVVGTFVFINRNAIHASFVHMKLRKDPSQFSLLLNEAGNPAVLKALKRFVSEREGAVQLVNFLLNEDSKNLFLILLSLESRRTYLIDLSQENWGKVATSRVFGEQIITENKFENVLQQLVHNSSDQSVLIKGDSSFVCKILKKDSIKLGLPGIPKQIT